MGGGARRERGASQQPRARLGRTIIVAFCTRKSSDSYFRFRWKGARVTVQMLPFGSAQLPHSGVRDTNQLVKLALFGIPDAAAQKKPPVVS